jgi:hypothetical protein
MDTKLFYVFILLLFINYEAKSQLDTIQIDRNVFYLEIGGIGGYGSVNYERIIPVKAKIKIGARIGISTYTFTDYTRKFNPDVIILLGINGFYGSKHNVEFGFGQTISIITQASESNWEPEKQTNLHANFTIGYRYQKDSGGIIFRCSYTPIIEFYKYYRNWGSISVGYAF